MHHCSSPGSISSLAGRMKEWSRDDEHTGSTNDRCCSLAHHHSSLLPLFLPPSSRQPSASHSSSPTRLTQQAHAHFLQHSRSSGLQHCTSAVLKSHTHSTFPPAVAAEFEAALSVPWSCDFRASWWLREKRWWWFRARVKKAQQKAGWGWVRLEYRVYPLCPWWLNTPVSCAGSPGKRALWKKRSRRKRRPSDSAATKCR